jgi:hypothetical protein
VIAEKLFAGPILQFDRNLCGGLGEIAEIAGSFVVVFVKVAVNFIHAGPDGIHECPLVLFGGRISRQTSINIIAHGEVSELFEVGELGRQRASIDAIRLLFGLELERG